MTVFGLRLRRKGMLLLLFCEWSRMAHQDVACGKLGGGLEGPAAQRL